MKNKKKINTRFSLFFNEEKGRLMIMIDPNIIADFLAQDENGEWIEYYQLCLEKQPWVFVSEFKEWRKGKEFSLTGQGTNKGKIYKYNKATVRKMKRAVMKRDKRLKLKQTKRVSI